jgi:glycosyltransferase involved in cell wall biosynthesis
MPLSDFSTEPRGDSRTFVPESQTENGDRPTLRAAAITPGRNVPSARHRVRQLLPIMRESGVLLDELVPAVSAYPPKTRLWRPLWGVAALAARIPVTVATYGYELTLLQREMVSTLVTLEPWTRQPRVLDVDDAIFLHRGGQAADRLARMCDSVICGNGFLAEWFSARNPRVVVLPTAVDTEVYTPPSDDCDRSAQVIGWIGTSANLRFLQQIEDSLAAVLRIRPRATLLVVSDAKPSFRFLPADRVEFRQWSPEVELAALRVMSLGIMPLEESLWAKGKCSFKMLSYMACALPVVASPVGMNKEVFALGDVGIQATTSAEWIQALVELLPDGIARRSMGLAGRKVAEKRFSTKVIAPRLAAHLLSVAGDSGETARSVP